MPFDVLPQETETKFKKWADALLRGCAVTAESIRQRKRGFCLETDKTPMRACAYYAIKAGFHGVEALRVYDPSRNLDKDPSFVAMRDKYVERYGQDFVEDFEDCGMSREEIAARIAAL